MNKKTTLLTVALMAVSSLTVSAADIPVDSKDWTAGNYYYLKADNNNGFLSLCGTKADSVIVKELKSDANKAARDSALWEVTKVGTETGGNPIYQFKNKKTKSILSFEKSETAKPILTEGISQWSFADKKIIAYWNADKSLALSVSGVDLALGKTTSTTFEVVLPEQSEIMSAADLGDGFSTFQLSMGETIEGDIFKEKDIIATVKDGYFLLQEKGNEAYDNGVKKYFGIDTLKTEGADALKTLGYKFSLDSIRKESGKINNFAKMFKFTADLKNDSLTMIVRGVPGNDSETKDVKVVYAKLDNKKVLTVTGSNGGILPFITTKRGTPAEIATGTGVYFLKSASKGENGGKYYYGGEFEAEKPSVNRLDGQWYIKEDGGLYSVVSRTGTITKLSKGEVFAVQGMENTYTFAGSTDSIIVEAQKVNFDDKYLGSLHFSKEELANNGYVLNLIPTGAETSNSYAFTSDSLLKVVSGDAKDAVIFKLDSVKSEKVGGAEALNDVVYIVTYRLKSQFSNKYVAYDDVKKCLKISTEADKALQFHFNTSVDGGKYDMKIVSEGDGKNKYVDAQVSSSNMILSETPAYFNFVEMDAPEYGTFESSHRRFTSDLKSLTMNPLNFFAEAKQEGQDILKSTYEKDNFSLWLSKSKASTAEKPLYFITTSLPKDAAKPEGDRVFYYMVSGRDSSLLAGDVARVNFIANDTIETMKDSENNPALFALKVTESGNYLLENQKEVTIGKNTPYVGIVNNVVVMTKDGVEFSVETAPAPVANEEIEAPSTVMVIGGVGEFSIRNAHGKKITVSNILGQTIGTRLVSSDYVTVPTTRGVVIVSVEGDKAYKVIVK